MTKTDAYFFARLVLALTFAVSAWVKINDLDSFHDTITAFKLASDRRARTLAPIVASAEILAVVLLVASTQTALFGLGLAALQLAIYTWILTRARLRGSTVGCNCFGKKTQKLSWYDVSRNVLLLAVVALGCATYTGALALATYSTGLLVAMAVAAVIVVVNLGSLAEAVRRPISSEEEQS
jgi:uncharacterized membrane protein YphA (DoxX/SURF4 family)